MNWAGFNVRKMDWKNKLTKTPYLVLVFAFVLLISLTVFSFDSAEAKKSAGINLPEIGSSKVCGDVMCLEPLSIEKKIAAFLESQGIHKRSVEQPLEKFLEIDVGKHSAPPKLESEVNASFEVTPSKPDSQSEVTYDVTYSGKYKFTNSHSESGKIFFSLRLSYNVTTIGEDEHNLTTFEVTTTSKNNVPLKTFMLFDEFTYNFQYVLEPDFSQVFIKFKKGDTEIKTIQIPTDGVIDLGKPQNDLYIGKGYVLRK